MKPSSSFPVTVRLLPSFGLLCLLGGAVLARTACADDVLPSPPPSKRYDKLAARSPFSPPTAGPALAAATPPPAAPSWSDNLIVTSLMQNGAVYCATVMEKDSSTRHLIRSDVEDGDTHLTLASVRWADRPDAIKVTVRKGMQFGDLKFDPNATSEAGAPVPGAPPGPGLRPGVPNPAANFHPPPPVASTAQNPSAGQPPGSIVRGRPVIRAPQPAPVRPVMNTPQGPSRAIPPVVKPASKDDDDDDDDN